MRKRTEEETMEYRIGQRVVCIKEYPHNHWPDCKSPRLNRVYTLREIRVGRHGQGLEFLLREIVNAKRMTPLHGYGEPSYHQSRFRPVVDGGTDISIFTQILTDQKVGEDA